MENNLNLKSLIHKKEAFYFFILSCASLIITLIIITTFVLPTIFLVLTPNIPKATAVTPMIFLSIYVLIFFFIIIFSQGILIGEIKNHCVKVTDKQLPNVHATVERLSKEIGLKKTPQVYIIQSGGSLNAFATKFFLGSKSFIVLYSDILELAFDQGEDAIEFIIAHELAHIKRNHIDKRFFLLPALLIPFLGNAYYRACEYTCDSFAKALTNTKAAEKGLAVLSLGKKLHASLNIEDHINSARVNGGFWSWFAEKLSTHPSTYKRFENIIDIR